MGVRQVFTGSGDILIKKLHDELAIELLIEGCAYLADGSVAVDFVNQPTAQDLIDAQAVIDAHDATDFEEIISQGAQTQFENIPDWATWDEATALAFFDANVTTAASAIPVLRAMVRMLIALRNETWPGLQD